MSQSPDSPSISILALDGGGNRGLAILVILDALMRKLPRNANGQPPKPCQVFDLICGTSTGGLLALMLGRKGMSVKECINEYPGLIGSIFKKSSPEPKLGEPLYDNGGLRHVCKKLGRKDGGSMPLCCAKDEQLACRSFVTTVEGMLAVPHTQLLRTYETEEQTLPLHHSWRLHEAVQATLATPNYFAPFRLEGHDFMDAGDFGFNNPSMLALEEAKKIFLGRKIGCFVSIGTGLQLLLRNGPIHDKLNEDKVKLVVPQDIGEVQGLVNENFKTLSKIVADTERVRRQIMEILGSDIFFRFNPPCEIGLMDVVDRSLDPKIKVVANNYVIDPATSQMITACANALKSTILLSDERIETQEEEEIAERLRALRVPWDGSLQRDAVQLCD